MVDVSSLSPLVETDATRHPERLRRRWRGVWLPLRPLIGMLLLLLLIARPHTPSSEVGDAVRGLQEERHDANPIVPCGSPRKSVRVAHARVISSTSCSLTTHSLKVPPAISRGTLVGRDVAGMYGTYKGIFRFRHRWNSRFQHWLSRRRYMLLR